MRIFVQPGLGGIASFAAVSFLLVAASTFLGVRHFRIDDTFRSRHPVLLLIVTTALRTFARLGAIAAALMIVVAVTFLLKACNDVMF